MATAELGYSSTLRTPGFRQLLLYTILDLLVDLRGEDELVDLVMKRLVIC